jgi:hypothetical protein
MGLKRLRLKNWFKSYAIVSVLGCGCRSLPSRPADTQRQTVKLPKLYAQADKDGCILTEAAGKPILLTFHEVPFVKYYSALDAGDFALHHIAAYNEKTLGSVAIAYEGKSWTVPVSKRIQFPDPRVRLTFGPRTSPEPIDEIDEEWLDSCFGAAYDPSNQRLAVTFAGGDGEGSYHGAIVLEKTALVGVAMEYIESSDSAVQFAEKALKNFRRLDGTKVK